MTKRERERQSGSILGEIRKKNTLDSFKDQLKAFYARNKTVLWLNSIEIDRDNCRALGSLTLFNLLVECERNSRTMLKMRRWGPGEKVC